MPRVAWLALAVGLPGCIQFDGGGRYACESFDDCSAQRESCFEGACVGIDPLAPGEKLGVWRLQQAAVAWVRWLQGLPQTNHPLYDGTGEQCGTGQPDDAFFLAGAEPFYGGSVTRACTVAAGRPLIFPLFWWLADNNGLTEDQKVDEPAMKQWVLQQADDVTELLLTVDGRPVPVDDLKRLRVGPVRTSYQLDETDPLNPPLQNEPFLIDPAYLDGYFVVLPPLRPGQHNLRFGSTYLVDGETRSMDSRYLLEVQ